jgi:hypothetical protein
MRRRSITFEMPYTSLGDKLCFLGAARAYARLVTDVKVHVGNVLTKVVEEYAWSPHRRLIHPGSNGPTVRIEPGAWHRRKQHDGCNNYVGTYLREMGVRCPPIRPELPPNSAFTPYKFSHFVAFQPHAGYAREPDGEIVDELLDTVRGKLPIVAVGAPETPRDYEGVDYGYLGDELHMIKMVRSAQAVITPRSASAHIAAAYQKRAVLWLPSDGENWHVDYPDWPARPVEFERPAWFRRQQMANAKAILERVIEETRF